ncbi:hypothetical protein Acsp04_66840 [Actinomadura sp. NBRC 104425]|uniref:helix-turn-helix domain-containing protein n=1 Tax=Actinomadura sp. NBRC 104425 TaxID=3032204 RepID=UPI0024A0F6D7|nr:helix-turn-helix transcriptional regulator [Actinomadura sp. NBRC 104425]GLZ16449.1 hypothetical protein Acsp04_66840 [Actinomadura sp. NBRC 104425]
MPPRPRALDPGDPRQRFALELRDLHRRAGKPLQQALAEKLHWSHTTLSVIFNGHRFPSWEQTKALVKVLGDDPADWLERWQRADREINEDVLMARPQEGIEQPAWYLNNEQFYANATERVKVANSRILVTYIRRRPPDYYTSEAAAAYFAAVIEWAKKPGARSVRRIICIPNSEMHAWATRHHEETFGVRNYEVRVVRWDIDADGINMALFDDSTTFLAFSGAASQELSGFRVDSPQFLRYFVGYFEQLWSTARPLEEYLRENS